MTVITGRPNATASSVSVTTTGAANAHTAQSDDTDASYSTWGDASDLLSLDFAEPSVPAGALVKSVGFRVRCSRVAGQIGSPALIFGFDNDAMDALDPAAAPVEQRTVISWTTPQTTTLLVAMPIAGLASVPVIRAYVRRESSNSKATFFSFEWYADVTYVAKPVVDVITPTGTVTDDSTPVVTATAVLDADGGALTHYHIKVFTAAQYGAGGFDPETSTAQFDSGETADPPPAFEIPNPLADGAYRTYVKVAQTIAGTQHWSDWNYEAFTIDLDRPAAPTLTLTDQPDDGRIRLVINDNAGTVSTDGYIVGRSLDNGVTWETIRTMLGYGIVAGSDVTIYDYEVPNGVEADYRVYAIHAYGDTYTFSATPATGSETWSSNAWWLKHPTDPSFNQVVIPRSQPSIVKAARKEAIQVLGRADPVMVEDERLWESGELVLRSDTDAAREALDALLQEGGPVLVQAPLAAYWEDRWLSFGDLTRERLVDTQSQARTFDSLPWFRVAVPAGNLVSFGEA